MSEVYGADHIATPRDGQIYTADKVASLEQDWQARSIAPGVVWAHDFRSANEVDYFRFVGGWGTDYNKQSPTDVAVGQSSLNYSPDGITGGSLESYTPAGGHADAVWYRPFAAIRSPDNGRTADDLAASDTLPVESRDWTNTGVYDDLTTGRYGSPLEGTFANDEFYIQMRIKLIGWILGDTGTGKFFTLDRSSLTSNQELVAQVERNTGQYSMYTNFGGNRNNSQLFEPQGPASANPTVTSFQPGGAFDATCDISAGQGSPGCWVWPEDQWITLLLRMKLGPNTGGPGGPSQAEMDAALLDPTKWTEIDAWIADYGDTVYTRIWTKNNYIWNYDPGEFLEQIQIGTFVNNQPSVVENYKRVAQIIFSHDPIPAPQVYV